MSGGALSPFVSKFYWTNQALPTILGGLRERTITIALGRHLDGGLHEDLRVANHGAGRACFDLELALCCDFADIFNVKSGKLVQRGEISSDWDAARQELSVIYTNADFRRGLRSTCV
ncbi:glycogen debranching N-terminal domain-containing protein [Rhodoblastus acidophilus]|uniref:glycogen debranching N-terminal domain-containing protein n=1 Tax=Rhodoblastus acidophilus TaxID=1074 RepID=UPI003CD02BA8